MARGTTDRWGMAAGVALAVSVLLLGCGGDQGQNGQVQAPGAAEVNVLIVQPRILELMQELPGRISATKVAEVRARVAGIVLTKHFQEGAAIKAGQLLFTIDPAQYKAALSRAQGELAKADAAVGNAQTVINRYTPLAKMDAISQQDLDTAQTTLQLAQAARTSAQADVETAQLNLAYTRVTAPIAGRIGRAAVTEGALVGQAGEATALATIQQLNPIYADFTQSVTDTVRARESQAGATPLHDGKLIHSKLSLAVEGSNKIREGKLIFADVTVDRSSGKISLRGEFPNDDGLLLPGMYVRVRTSQGTEPAAMLVPQRAVKRTSDGQAQVLIVGADQKVQARPVQTGAMYGSDWHILNGLQTGDSVIIGGPAVNPGDQVTVAHAQPMPAPSASAPETGSKAAQ